jgi:hypothetical protein
MAPAIGLAAVDVGDFVGVREQRSPVSSIVSGRSISERPETRLLRPVA